MNCPHTQEPLKEWRYSSDFLIAPTTKIIYNQQWQSLNYDQDYFLKEYKNQYQITYLEDEENLRNIYKKRIKVLKKFLSFHSSLLELGCATGFFLDEVKNIFSKTLGIEISTFASFYGKKKFNLNIENIDLIEFISKNTQRYDVVASFYVIEHFKEQKKIFEFISKTLNKNGLWICSLPSTFGPLFMFHPLQWKETHPKDHFVDYNPKALKTILKLYHLKLLWIRPASYHQERTKGFLNFLTPRMYQLYSDFTCFGDTLEFIAVKQ